MNARRPTRISRLALALEPRMMFDAAAVATAVETHDQSAEQKTTAQAQQEQASKAPAAVSAAATLAVPGQSPTLGGSSTAVDWAAKADGYDSETFSNVLEGVNDMTLSADGKYAYAVRFADGQPAALSVFARDDQGQLTLIQTFYQYKNQYDETLGDNVQIPSTDGLDGAQSVTLSSDQRSLYVVGRFDQAVVMFNRDPNSGQLQYLGTLDTLQFASLENPTSVRSHGDYVYITADTTSDGSSNGSISVFKRNIDGSLTHQQTLIDDQGTNGLAGARTQTLTVDGRFLFVSGGGESAVAAFAIETDGKLRYLNAVMDDAALFSVSSMALSVDGKSLYAVNQNFETGRLTTLNIAEDGRLTLGSSIEVRGATAVAVSPDGTAVYVLSQNDGLFLFARDASGALTLIRTRTDLPSLNSTHNMVLSQDGTQLYVTASGNDPTIIRLDVRVPDAVYAEGTPPTPLLPSARLNDPQLDALNGGAGNYDNASLSIMRLDGAVADDVFGLAAGNGLSLSGNQIFKDGVFIASFVQSAGALTITFSGTVSRADAQNVLRQVTYSNSSNDPEHLDPNPAFGITLDDGDGHSTRLEVRVELQGQNDPAVLQTLPQTPRLVEDGEFVTLFKDTRIDTIETGQNVFQVSLTLNAIGPNEVLRVNGQKIVIDGATNGVINTPGGLTYSITVNEGVATLLLYLSVNPTDAAKVIDSIAYNNTGSNLSGTREISLVSIRESAGWKPVQTDFGEHLTRFSGLTAVVTLAPAAGPNTAPVLNNGGAQPQYQEGNGPSLLMPGATVTDAQWDTFNGGQGNYHGAVLTISLGAGATSHDLLGFAAGNGLAMDGLTLKKDGVIIAHMTFADGVMTLTFTEDNKTTPTSADLNNVLRQITYHNDSRSPAEHLQVHVTLADNRLVSDALVLDLSIATVNDAPLIDADPVLSVGPLEQLEGLSTITGLTGIKATQVSSDGAWVYVSDDQGAIALFQRNTQTGTLTYVSTLAGRDLGEHRPPAIEQMLIGSDGTSLYARTEDAILVFSRNTGSGELTLLQTLVADTDNHHSLFSTLDIAQSADGKGVYIVSDSFGLLVYNRDAGTGQLSFVQQMAQDAWVEPYLFNTRSIATFGNYLIAANDMSAFGRSSMVVYERQGDGSLQVKSFLRDGELDQANRSVSLGAPRHISVSVDGKTLYLASSTGISLFTFEPVTAAYLYQGEQLANLNDISDIALSNDGKTLFVTRAAGSISRYATDRQTLTWVDTLDSTQNTALANAKAIILANDGTLLVVGDTLANLRTPGVDAPNYTSGVPVLIAPTLTLGDAERDAANAGHGDYNGASITVVRDGGADPLDQFAFVADNDLSLSPDGQQLLKNGHVIASFSNNSGQLTITFSTSVDRQTANQVLRQITFASTGEQADGIILAVRLNDGQLDSSIVHINLDISEVNDAPTLHTTPRDPKYVLSTEAQPLFGDTRVSTVESRQSILGLSLTFAGIQNSTEFLWVDRTQIALVDGSGKTASNLDYRVQVNAGVATLTLSSATGISSSSLQTLVNGIAYFNEGEGDGTRVATLTSLRDSGGTAQGGQDTRVLNLVSTLTLVENEIPVLLPGADITHKGGVNVPVLADAHLSDKELDSLNGQNGNYGGASLTLAHDSVSGSTIAFGVNPNSGFQLSQDGKLTSGNIVLAIVSQEPGQLVLTFSDGVSKAQATAILNSITYSTDRQGEHTVVVTATFNDGRQNSAASVVRLHLTEVNDAPTLDTRPINTSYTQSGSEVALFLDTKVSAVETGQRVKTLILSVSGILDGTQERLKIDGQSLALLAGEGALSNGMRYVISIERNVATLTLTSDVGLDSAAMQKLVDGLRYSNSSALIGNSSRVVTLVSIQDNGGITDGGQDTTTLNLKATVDIKGLAAPPIVPVNPAPVDPTPVDPTPVDPTPVNPGLPVNPAPVDPIDPTPAGPQTSSSVTPVILAADFSAVGTGQSFQDNTTPGWASTGQAPEQSTRQVFDAVNALSIDRATSSLFERDQLTSDDFDEQDWQPTADGQYLATLSSDPQEPAAQLSLPAAALIGLDSRSLQVRMANGLPLPGWIRFDPRTGKISLDNRTLGNVRQVQLQILGRDAQGQERRTLIKIQVQDPRSAPLPQDDAAPARSASLEQQLQQQSSTGLAAQAQALLDSLRTLFEPDRPASPVDTDRTPSHQRSA